MLSAPETKAGRLQRQVLELVREHERLMADNVSLERASYELQGDRPASPALIDALVYSLRRGVNELTRPDTQRRLSELSEDQLLTVCERLQNFKPEIAPAWTPDEVVGIVAIWRKIHA